MGKGMVGTESRGRFEAVDGLLEQASGGQGHAEVAVRLDVLRVQVDGPPEALFGQVPFAELVVDTANPDVGVGGVRVEIESPAEARQRRLALALALEHHTEVIVVESVGAVDPDGLSDQLLGPREIPPLVGHQTQAVERGPAAGIRLEDFAVQRLRGFDPPGLVILQREPGLLVLRSAPDHGRGTVWFPCHGLPPPT